MHAGDLAPPFLFQLTHGVPPVLIPDDRVQKVELQMAKEGRVPVALGECFRTSTEELEPNQIEEFLPGVVYGYQWTDPQTSKAGRYVVTAKVTWDTNKPETFPNGGFLPLEILAR